MRCASALKLSFPHGRQPVTCGSPVAFLELAQQGVEGVGGGTPLPPVAAGHGERDQGQAVAGVDHLGPVHGCDQAAEPSFGCCGELRDDPRRPVLVLGQPVVLVVESEQGHDLVVFLGLAVGVGGVFAVGVEHSELDHAWCDDQGPVNHGRHRQRVEVAVGLLQYSFLGDVGPERGGQFYGLFASESDRAVLEFFPGVGRWGELRPVVAQRQARGASAFGLRLRLPRRLPAPATAFGQFTGRSGISRHRSLDSAGRSRSSDRVGGHRR